MQKQTLIGKLVLVFLLGIFQQFSNAAEDYYQKFQEVINNIPDVGYYTCQQIFYDGPVTRLVFGGQEILTHYYFTVNSDFDLIAQKKKDDPFMNAKVLDIKLVSSLDFVVAYEHMQIRRFYLQKYTYSNTDSTFGTKVQIGSDPFKVQPIYVSSVQYVALTIQDRIHFYTHSDLQHHEDVPCIEQDHTDLTKEEFGCSSMVTYIDTSVYLISGIYLLPGIASPTTVKKEGIIVKEIIFDTGVTDLLKTNSENYWELCYNDNCSTTGSEVYIPYLQIVTEGNIKYLYAAFTKTSYTEEDFTDFQITGPDIQMSNDMLECVPPPDRIRRILPADPCYPTGTEFYSLEDMELLPNGEYWHDDGTNFVTYTRLDLQIYVQTPTYTDSIYKVYKSFETNISTGTPSNKIKDYEFTGTDVNIRGFQYFNHKCRQYFLLVQAQQASSYEIHDVDQPYFDLDDMNGKLTINQQFNAQPSPPLVDIPFTFSVDLSYFNGQEDGLVTFAVADVASWATIDPITLQTSGTPLIDNHVQEDDVKITATHTTSGKTFCEVFNLNVGNKPPISVTQLQDQIEDGVGSFITEARNEFRSAEGTFSDPEGKTMTLSVYEIVQIDTSTPFRDETVLLTAPDWLSVSVIDSPLQIVFVAIPPQLVKKYEYRITVAADDGYDIGLNTFILKIVSFKNPFLGLEYSSSQFSDNEKAIKLGQFVTNDSYFIVVFIQDIGLQLNQMVNVRVQKLVKYYEITEKVVDMMLYKKNNSQFLVILAYGNNKLTIVDVTNPYSMVEFAEITTFNAVYKLKLFTVKEDNGGNPIDVEYLGIFDETQGLIIATCDDQDQLINVRDDGNAALGIFADVLVTMLGDTQIYVGILGNDVIFYVDDGTAGFASLTEKLRLRKSFEPKQIDTFSDEKFTYLTISTIEHGLNIFKLDEDTFNDIANGVTNNSCTILFNFSDSGNNSADSVCSDLKSKLSANFISQFDLKNAVDMYMFRDPTVKMLIVSDGYLGVKLISVNFPSSPKLVTSYQTFDAQASIYFEYENEIYLLVADERQGNKLLQLIQGSDDKPFFSYALEESRYSDGFEDARWVKKMKLGDLYCVFVLDDLQYMKLINVSNVSKPAQLQEYDFGAEVSSIDIQPFNFKIFVLVHLADESMKVYQVDETTFEMTEQQLELNGSSSTITGVQCYLNFFFDVSTFIIAVSDHTKVIFYSFTDEGNDTINFVTSFENTSLQNIQNIRIEVFQFFQTIFFFQQDTKEVHIYRFTDQTTLQLQTTIVVEDFMHEFAFYDQKKYDENDPEVVIQQNQILAIADGYRGLKFYNAEDLTNLVFLHQLNTYNTICVKLLNFDASGLFLAYTDDIKGFRLLQLNFDIEEVVPQQRIVYYTDYGPSQYLDIREENGRIYGFLADGNSGFKVIEISSDIGLYPKLGQVIDNNQKQYTVKFYPVYKTTLSAYLYSISLIDIKITEASRKILSSMPYWTTLSLQSRTINLVPPEKDSLLQTQFIYYKFSTEIDPEVLRIDLLGEDGSMTDILNLLALLQEYGFVTSTQYYYLTSSYDPAQDMNLPHEQFEPAQVFQALKQFFYEGFTELNTAHYAALNSVPELVTIDFNEIQDEFEKQVGNPLKIGQNFFFEFFEIFIDYDNDPLEYKVKEVRVFENIHDYRAFQERQQSGGRRRTLVTADGEYDGEYELVSFDSLTWINFNPTEKIFSGSPTQDALDKIYILVVVADDGYQPGETTLLIDLTDNGPILSDDAQLQIQSQYNHYADFNQPHPGNEFRFDIVLDLFIDPEGDPLRYEIHLQEHRTDEFDNIKTLFDTFDYDSLIDNDDLWNPQVEALGPFNDYWMSFDNLTGQLNGIPEKENIGYYRIKMTAWDLNKPVTATFIMSITNEQPYLSTDPLLQLQSQYNVMVYLSTNPHPEDEFKFTLDFNLYKDIEGDTLTYDVDVQVMDPAQVDTIKQKFDDNEFDDLRTTPSFWQTPAIRLLNDGSYWMKFDPQFGEIVGIPQLEDLGYLLVTVTANDMTLSVSDSFVMSITNIAPNLSDDTSLYLQNQYNYIVSTQQIPHPFDEFEMTLQLELFEDLEGDELDYVVEVREALPDQLETVMQLYKSNGFAQLKSTDAYWTDFKIVLTPGVNYWMQFDRGFGQIYGTPQVDNIGAYKVTIIGSDINSEVSDTFFMTVENEGPVKVDDNDLQLQSQYAFMVQTNVQPHPYNKFSLTMQMELFTDFEDDSLVYTVEVQKNDQNALDLVKQLYDDQMFENLFQNDNLWDSTIFQVPDNDFWMNFDGNSEIFGVPQVEDLGYYKIKLTASDMTKQASDTFFMSITNENPYLTDDASLLLQSQYKNYIINNMKPHPGVIFRLELNFDLFVDPENDDMEYLVNIRKNDATKLEQVQSLFDAEGYESLRQNDALWEFTNVDLLPSTQYWMSYDRETKTIEGTPSVEELGYFFVTVTASDMTLNIQDSFFFSVTNVEPYLSDRVDMLLQSQYGVAILGNKYPHPGKEFRFQFDTSLFIDEENDPLAYTVFAQAQTPDEAILPSLVQAYDQGNYDLMKITDDFWERQETPLLAFSEFWLKFDAEYNELFGTPEVEDYKFFRVKIIAADITGEISDNFIIKVINTVPYLNKKIQNQVPNGRVDSEYSYQFDRKTFLDDDLDDLQYSAITIPDWLTFDEKTRTVTGIPLEKGSYEVQIQGTDIVGEFNVYKYEIDIGISWLQLIGIIVGMISPFASAFTLFKYQQLIYAILCKRKYQYLRYDLAPVNQVYVKQIPLIRLELKETKNLFDKFKKRAMQELRLKYGKKSKLYREWITQLYYDSEFGEFKIDEIIQDLVKVAKENKIQPVINNFNNNETTTSHYFIMIKAQMARELLKKDYQGWKIYNMMKKNLKDVPVFHFDDKGNRTKSMKSYRDWYRCLITQVNYDYVCQEQNMLPEYELDEILIETLMRQQYNEIQETILKNPKIKKLTDDELDILQSLITENIHAEIQGILIEYLKPFGGLAHGNSLILRTQNIKSLQAYVRIDTYNSGNKMLANLSFFKTDYVPLAGSVNDILPEWLNFTINNGVLEFQGIPPVDYLGRHLMIQVISNKNYILEEFYIKFSDDVQEKDLDKRKVISTKKKDFLTHQQGANEPFTGATLYSKKFTRKSQFLSQIMPSTRYLTNQSDTEIFKEMKLQSVKKLKEQEKKTETQIKLIKKQNNTLTSQFSLLEIELYTIEQLAIYIQNTDSQLKKDIYSSKQRNLLLKDYESSLLFEHLAPIRENEKVLHPVKKCMRLFAAIVFNDPKILEIKPWIQVKEQLAKITPETDFSVESYQNSVNQDILEQIKDRIQHESWFKLMDPDQVIDEKVLVYSKWIQLIFSNIRIEEMEKLQIENESIIKKSAFGQGKKDEIEEEIERVYKEKSDLDRQLSDQEQKLQIIKNTLASKEKERLDSQNNNENEGDQNIIDIDEEEKSQVTEIITEEGQKEEEFSLNSERKENLIEIESGDDDDLPDERNNGLKKMEQNGSDLLVRLELSKDVMYDLVILGYYRNEVISLNQNGEVFINHQVIGKKRKEMKEKFQEFQNIYRKAIDFKKLTSHQFDIDNILGIQNLCCEEGYPEIQNKWNLVFYVISNSLEIQVDLIFMDNKENQFVDMTYEPCIVKGEGQSSKKFSLIDEMQQMSINFEGSLEKGYFSINLDNFFNPGQELTDRDQASLNKDKLFTNYLEEQ